MGIAIGASGVVNLLLTALLPASTLAAEAAPGDSGRPAASVRDTVVGAEEIRKQARKAQIAFERTRRRNLPWWNQRPERCDEVIGRYCIWHDDPEYEPAPENESIGAARWELLQTLAQLSEIAPADDWIVGQRVNYFVEAGSPGEAMAVARSCRAAPWWCAALVGFVAHAEGRYVVADSAFATAVASMPADTRCRWNDLSHLLGGDLRKRYRSMSCAERAELERRVWGLADPLYLVPGNDRRTEHFSRWVLNTLQPDGISPMDDRWGADLEEILVRYGWPVAWSRRPRPWSMLDQGDPPSITGHDPTRSYRFIPPVEFVEDPLTIDSESWDIEPHRPREEYLPPYARHFEPLDRALDHQIAVFRRRDSTLVVGAYRWKGDESLALEPVDIGLTFVAADGETLASSGSPNRRGVLAVRAPAVTGVLALEGFLAAEERATRLRRGVDADALDRAAISDVLVLDAPPEGIALPSTVEQAMHRARPSGRVRPGERLALFWEVYGVSEGDVLDVSVTLTKEGKSFFRRVAEWTGLAGEREPSIGLEWREETRGDETELADGIGVARSLELLVPPLGDGDYLLAITVRTSDGGELVTRRGLRVEER